MNNQPYQVSLVSGRIEPLPTRLDSADLTTATLIGSQWADHMGAMTRLTDCMTAVEGALQEVDDVFPEELRPLAYQAMFNGMKANLEARGLRFWLDT
jgi:hypothetical protein